MCTRWPSIAVIPAKLEIHEKQRIRGGSVHVVAPASRARCAGAASAGFGTAADESIGKTSCFAAPW